MTKGADNDCALRHHHLVFYCPASVPSICTVRYVPVGLHTRACGRPTQSRADGPPLNGAESAESDPPTVHRRECTAMRIDPQPSLGATYKALLGGSLARRKVQGADYGRGTRVLRARGGSTWPVWQRMLRRPCSAAHTAPPPMLSRPRSAAHARPPRLLKTLLRRRAALVAFRQVCGISPPTTQTTQPS